MYITTVACIDKANGLESDVDSDFSDITEQEIKFLCGCGKCSLKSFLANGCMNPLEDKVYPLLNFKKLSKRQKINFITRLELEAESIRDEFSALSLNVTRSLQNRPCRETVGELKVLIASMQLIRFMQPAKKEIVTSDLKKCESIADIMNILLDDLFVSWFNHNFLASIVNHFNICREHYTNYVEKTLQPFLQKSLFEIPRNSFSSKDPEISEKFILKIDVPSSREVQANIVPLLKGKVAQCLGITVSSLDLCAYDKGCIEITVGAPAQILQALFTSQPLVDILIDLGSMVIEPDNIMILSISYCSDVHKTIYRQECKVCP